MYPPIQTRCFKAYDIRGQVPADLNDDVAYRIGRALVAQLGGRTYVGGVTCAWRARGCPWP